MKNDNEENLKMRACTAWRPHSPGGVCCKRLPLAGLLVLLAALVVQAGIEDPVPGRLTDSYSRVAVSGASAVGGLVGTLAGGAIIERSYSTGSVTATVDGAGGLLGALLEGSVGDSYWDSESSQEIYSPAGDGRNTAAMIAPHDPDTFVGWDFSAVWAADAELVQNDGYPYLLGAQIPYHLIYQAGIGGQVVGETRQSLLPGVLGASVGLQAELGAFFAGWSDGGADATRSDSVVDSDRLLIARFRSAGGADLDWYAGHGFAPGDGQNWSDLDALTVSGKNSTLLQEFIADTDPHDPESRLRVLGLELAAPLRVHFAPASAARLYTLQFKDDLAEGEWSDLPGVDPQSGSGGSDHLVDPDPAQLRFYRIRATLP